MTTKRSSLPCLIGDAMRHGRATASEGRWVAEWSEDGYVVVWHHRTAMIAYHPATGDALGLSRGWGSMTDKCGIARVLRGVGARQSTYREVFAD